MSSPRVVALPGAVAVALVALLALLITGSERENRTPPLEPRMAELPGGFDPVPQFDETTAELRHRGADCEDESHQGPRPVQHCGR